MKLGRCVKRKTHPHTITDAVFWTIRMVLFLFGPADMTSIISENIFKCGLVRPQHTFPLCVSPSQMSSGPEKPVAFLGVVDIWLSLCMVEFYLALVDLARNWQGFSQVFLSPCGNILYKLMSVFNAVQSEGSNVTGIQCWFSTLPCQRAQISPDSLNLLMML